MKFFTDMKNKNRINNRQRLRQRLKVKAILRIGAVFFVLYIIGLVVFFNFSNSKKTKAKQDDAAFALVQDQNFITDMSISQPVITHEPLDKNTMQFRARKSE